MDIQSDSDNSLTNHRKRKAENFNRTLHDDAVAEERNLGAEGEQGDEETPEDQLEDNETELAVHMVAVRKHLESQLFGFAELDLALADLADVESKCGCVGLGAKVLEALDEMMATSEDIGRASQADTLNVACDVDIDSSSFEDPELQKRQHADVLACMGNYFSLFRFQDFAKQQYEAALAIDESNFFAQLGLAKILAERWTIGNGEEFTRARREALAACLSCTRLLFECFVPSRSLEGLAFERVICQCVYLLDNISDLVLALGAHSLSDSEELTEMCQKGAMHFLHASSPFVNSSAAGAIESLARKWFDPAPWLPKLLQLSYRGSDRMPDVVMGLLVNSQTFCHPGMEQYVRHWRANASDELSKQISRTQGHGIDVQSELLSRVGEFAALACHCHFVGYCIPFLRAEEEELALLTSKAILSNSTSNSTISKLCWLLVAMYEVPVNCICDIRTLQSVAFEGGAPSQHHAIEALHERVNVFPQQEAELALAMDLLCPSSPIPETPCREFYDATVYPPWHLAIESAGVVPATIKERLRRLYPWHEAKERACAGQARILIAGCGSGHQVAVELRTYSNCNFVALDCSARTAAYAKRKLRQVLSDDDFERVRFVVGDILKLGDIDAVGIDGKFDLIICCGVLHHLKDPAEGLRRLSSLLALNGVLQLATYSKISVDSWHGLIQKFLRSLPASSHLFDGKGQVHRSPTQAEVREIRKEVLALPSGHEVRNLLVHFREFFTYAGILDLLFHPLETMFTLKELLQGPLFAASLQVLGICFLDANNDLRARTQFRAVAGNSSDPRMTDLLNWHALEETDPDIFGRMHCLFLVQI